MFDYDATATRHPRYSLMLNTIWQFLFPPGAAPQPAPQQRPRKIRPIKDRIITTPPYYAMGYPPLPFPPQIQWQPQLPPFANPPGHFMPPPFAPPGYPPVGYRGSVLPAPAPALATLPDHSNSSPEDWPSGYVRLERVKGVEERKWKANKWVWRSIGVVQHEGYAAEKRTCMGVFRCDSCGRLTRPQTEPSNRAKQIRQGCTSRTCSLEQPLLHDECVASSYHYNYARGTETTLVWEHFGDHSTHSRPPGGKLSKFEEDEVDLQVLRKHEATAHELRTGDTGPGSTPFPDISPTLANPNAARYALGQSQARLGMVTTSSKGDLALMGGFADLGKRLSTPFIVDASVSGPVYITLQTPSMDGIIRECVESWILDLADGPSAGRHGILVDGDHSFFRVGPLIYLVQCIYISEEDL
ncbi:hypothetical protein B0H13DRAFT_1854939 [Mycena leptocephala]|nr:hypothetical protein B0H13DRAFT_1854939 [Mycena leptocephala]